MTPKTLSALEKVDGILKKTVEATGIALFVSLLLKLVYMLLSKNLFTAWQLVHADLFSAIFRYAIIVFLCIFLLAVCMRMVLSPFVKSDEERAFEQKVDYVMSKKKPQTVNSLVQSPLQNLTEEQEILVIKLLRGLPPHIDKPNQINNAMVSQYLTALSELGYLNDKDKYNLHNWVREATQKEVPAFNHFNEGYPSKAVRKVLAAKQRIEKELHIDDC